MLCFTRTSAESVFKNTREKQTDTVRLSLHAAQNAFCAGQLILREHKAFTIQSVRFANFSAQETVGESDVSFYFQDFIRYNDGEYPDILSDAKTCSVEAETTQSIWVVVNVKSDAAPGVCAFDAVVATDLGEFTFPCAVRVYRIPIPDADKASFYLEYFLNPYTDLMGPRHGRAREKFLISYAESLKMIRCNCIEIRPLPLLIDGGSRRVSETEWHLDFTFVERYIDFMASHVPAKRFSIGAIVDSVDATTVSAIGFDGQVEKLEYKTEAAEAWLNAWFGGLYALFQRKGMLDMLQFRIQDEPHYTDCWIRARNIAEKAAPGVKCGEPLDEHDVALGLEGHIDQYIPRINVYDPGADYYDRMRKSGRELWAYSCCYPEEAWYLNKFIDHPLAHNRLMTWVCFKRHIEGFLHWGYNFWSDTSLYGSGKDARFKGDAFIVYPDKENGRVLWSNRLLATAEGIIEYELLKIVESRDPAEADAICARVARTFCDFNDDPDKIDEAHIRLLEAAEACRS